MLEFWPNSVRRHLCSHSSDISPSKQPFNNLLSPERCIHLCFLSIHPKDTLDSQPLHSITFDALNTVHSFIFWFLWLKSHLPVEAKGHVWADWTSEILPQKSLDNKSPAKMLAKCFLWCSPQDQQYPKLYTDKPDVSSGLSERRGRRYGGCRPPPTPRARHLPSPQSLIASKGRTRDLPHAPARLRHARTPHRFRQ